MLRVRLDVNGELIDELLIVNRGRVDDSGSDERFYDWTDSAGLAGRIRHRRSLGAAQLVAHVLDSRARRVSETSDGCAVPQHFRHGEVGCLWCSARAVACPTCGAQPGHGCTSRHGRATHYHLRRVQSR